MSQQGFNDGGFGVCYSSGNPVICWLDPDIPCDRGPESMLMILFAVIPYPLELLIPSIVMAILFVKVKTHQENIFIDAKSIAKQGVRIL